MTNNVPTTTSFRAYWNPSRIPPRPADAGASAWGGLRSNLAGGCGEAKELKERQHGDTGHDGEGH
jgi:hypothetical protein